MTEYIRNVQGGGQINDISHLSEIVRHRLDDLYLSGKYDCSFASPLKLWEEYKLRFGKSDRNTKFSDIKKYVMNSHVYQLYGYERKAPKRASKIIVHSPLEVFQADLGFFDPKIARLNKGIRYFLIIVDCFTQFVKAALLKKKDTVTVTEAARELMDPDYRPVIFETDQGTEFISNEFHSMLTDIGCYNQVVLYHPVKAAFAENIIKLIKQKLTRYMEEQQTKQIIEQFHRIVEALNSRKLKRLDGLRPKEVSLKNFHKIYEKVYGKYLHEVRNKTRFKFHKGDIVRLALIKGPFEKGK